MTREEVRKTKRRQKAHETHGQCGTSAGSIFSRPVCGRRKLIVFNMSNFYAGEKLLVSSLCPPLQNFLNFIIPYAEYYLIVLFHKK